MELPLQAFLAGEHQSALDEQAALAEKGGRVQALHQLRLASMALALGDEETAESALRQAVGEMQDFTAEGEFRALLGRESTKTWKGEPYEKMAAFFLLGCLLYAEGDHGNARAMYKSAVLADAGTVEQRYRSDFVPAYLMMALSYDAQGKREPALDALQRAEDALWSQTTIEVLQWVVMDVGAQGRAEELAQQLLLMGLPAGSTAEPRDPERAARGAVSQAGEIYRLEKERRPKQRHPDLRGFPTETWDEVPEALERLGRILRERAAGLDPALFDEPRERAGRLRELFQERPNVLLVIEAGDGPHKAREGSHGHLLVIREGDRVREPTVSVDGEELPVLALDSYSYQATTRGGRRVDAYLEGKAVYKDASYVTGWALWEIAEVLAGGKEVAQTVAAALYVTGCVLMVSSLATMPQADIREWGMVPEILYLAPARLPPGEHELRVDGQLSPLFVPEQGQAVRVLPRLGR